MSEIFIEDLPNELMIQIFKWLNPCSLKHAVLTCKLWNQLIVSSRTWPLLLDHTNYKRSEEPWTDFCLKTNRKFHTIRVNYLILEKKNSIIEIFRRLGPTVVKLIFSESCMDTFDIFVEMLKCLPNLEHIILNEATTLGKVFHMPRDLPELFKLKTLDIVESEFCIAKCLTRSQLKTIKIHGSAFQCSDDSIEDLNDLLITQQSLTTLAFRAIDYKTCDLYRTKILNSGMRFQLTKLSLLDIKLRHSTNDYVHLLKFMKFHAKTIEELQLGRTFPNFIYEFVFAELENLQSLQLMINELPKQMTFYARLLVNRSINNLILTDSTPPSGCPPWLQEFIRHVPNVTSLTLLETCNKETVAFIASNITGLKKLATKTFNGFIFGGIQFPQLTTLNIHNLNAEMDWHAFTKDNSRITELTIEIVLDEYEVLQDHDVNIITKNLKLQTLKIGDNYLPSGAGPDFFNMIRRNCPTLKVFYLHDICGFNAAEIIEEEGEEETEDRYGHRIAGLRFCDNTTNCMLTCCNGLEFWTEDDHMKHFDDCGSKLHDSDSLGSQLMDYSDASDSENDDDKDEGDSSIDDDDDEDDGSIDEG